MDLTTIVVHLAQDIVEAESLAVAVAFAIGLWFCGSAISSAIKKSSAPGSDISGSKIFGTFFIGVLLAQFSFSMGSVWDSMTGSSTTTYGMVSYAGASAAGAFAPAVNAVLTIISTFGWWYGLKGFTQLRRASSGGGGGGYEDYAWKGFIHILGGAAMINIATTLDAFKETLGLTF
jgi:hypothetical protein